MVTVPAHERRGNFIEDRYGKNGYLNYCSKVRPIR